MNLLFMGTSEFAIASLRALSEAGHTILLVVTQPDKPAGRGQKSTPPPIAEASKELGLRLAQPATLKDPQVVQTLKDLKPDAIVVVAYGKFLPKDILEIPEKGCINVHPSLLPRYRGAAPINWAIINGETVTGVTTMLINERMDEGDILLQCAVEITDSDTSETLTRHLAVVGAELLRKTLERIERGSLKGIPQDHALATYAPTIKKEDGVINWNNTAKNIYNLIRGLQPWPRAYTFLNGERIIIHDSSPLPLVNEGRGTKGEGRETKDVASIVLAKRSSIVLRGESGRPSSIVPRESEGEPPGTILDLEGGITVATGKGKLCLLELQREGKKRITAVEFIRGARISVGMVFK